MPVPKCPLPAAFVLPVWVGHARALLHDWLDTQFRWNGTPLAQNIAAVNVTFHRPGLDDQQDDRSVRVWTSPHPRPAPLPAPTGPASWTLDESAFTMWHPAWQDLAEHWHLDGPWLHPETRYEIDPLRMASDASCLFIGCVDREDPSLPPRYDPALFPMTHDIGVIAFCLHPHRALQHYHAGYDAQTAMLLCAGTAVATAAVHEALETFQVERGTPVLDPHSADVEVAVTAFWRDGHGGCLTTEGYAA